MSYRDKCDKYKWGAWKAPVPPVDHANWTTDAWVTWIDNYGVWL
jgi:hypothetical protein